MNDEFKQPGNRNIYLQLPSSLRMGRNQALIG